MAGGILMDLAPEVIDLIRRTADGFPWGPQRRRYMADTVDSLGLGQRQAQLLFHWGRDTIRKALRERRSGITCQDATCRRGRRPAELRLPGLLDDITDVVKDHVQTDPTFQTPRLFCRLSAPEVRRQLLQRKGYTDEQLPSIQTITTKLNALGFRLSKVAKSRPKKSQTDRRDL
jgi:Rhodopirellula transposase DDE domain